MTTTQTPNRRPPAPPRRPDADPKTKPAIMRFRPAVSLVGVVMIAAAVFYLAVNIGRGQQIAVSAVLLAIAGTFCYIGQQAWLYSWLESKQRRAEDSAGVAEATPAPKVMRKQRGKKTAPQEEFQVPELKPARTLGAEFGYIIMLARGVARRDSRRLLADMSRLWDSHNFDGDQDLDIGLVEEEDDFVTEVNRVYALAAKHPGYAATATQEQLLNGDQELAGNPYAFLAEAESYHPLIGAIAAFMLVRHQVGSDSFDIIMEPWTELGLSYRVDDRVFTFDPKAGKYGSEPVRKSAARTPGNTAAVLPVNDGAGAPAGTLDEVITARAGMAPAPAAAAPAPTTAHEVTEEDLLLAAELIIRSGFGSTAMLERKMRIEFDLAGAIMNRLHFYGIVGKDVPDGVRDVMVPPEDVDFTLDFLRDKEAERRKRAARG